jgi:hypothetical protein
MNFTVCNPFNTHLEWCGSICVPNLCVAHTIANTVHLFDLGLVLVYTDVLPHLLIQTRVADEHCYTREVSGVPRPRGRDPLGHESVPFLLR